MEEREGGCPSGSEAEGDLEVGAMLAVVGRSGEGVLGRERAGVGDCCCWWVREAWRGHEGRRGWEGLMLVWWLMEWWLVRRHVQWWLVLRVRRHVERRGCTWVRLMLLRWWERLLLWVWLCVRAKG